MKHTRLQYSVASVLLWQAAELRQQIEQTDILYQEILDQWQNGFLSASDYQIASKRNRDDYERLRAEFDRVSILPFTLLCADNFKLKNLEIVCVVIISFENCC